MVVFCKGKSIKNPDEKFSIWKKQEKTLFGKITCSIVVSLEAQLARIARASNPQLEFEGARLDRLEREAEALITIIMSGS